MLLLEWEHGVGKGGGGYRGESLLGENGVLAKVFKHISLFGPNEWAGLKDVI